MAREYSGSRMGCQSRSGMNLNNWLKNNLYRALPTPCVLCGMPVAGALPLCDGCRGDLIPTLNPCPRCGDPLPEGVVGPCGRCLQHPPPFASVTAPLLYRPPLDGLLLGLKFHRALHHAPLLADLLVAALTGREQPLPGLLLPVPLHPLRLRERGYNQALEISRALGRRLAIPVRHDRVRRIRHTESQSRLRADQRRRNLRGAFALERAIGVPHVAIIDDVITTGATVAELARLLRRHGVERVEVWCVARAPHP